MLIYLLRHGDASQEYQNDSQRPLSEKGKESVKKVAEYVLRNKINLTRLITSPILRAWQTANIVAEVLKLNEKIEESDSLMPDSNPDDILSNLARLDNNERILLVGHQPLFGILISNLICKGFANIEVKKASLACIEIHQPINIGKGVLKFFINPEIIN